MNKVESHFPVRALLIGLRSIGYSFPTAVADIMDNSISAGAHKIGIWSDPLAREPYFAIADDGCGMSPSELDNAMLFGSDRTRKSDSPLELGRFGLGLKAASLSQCRMFTVASKKHRGVTAMSFDVDEVERTGKLVLSKLNEREIAALPKIDALSRISSGTLVIWRKFDKIEDSAAVFERSFRSAVADAQKHAELVFHRFYDSVFIEFNGVRVAKRDPFLLQSHPRQQTGRTSELKVPGTDATISVTPYSLPYANSLTQEERHLLGDPRSVYDDQGFYLYRNRRLIAWGGWMRMGMRSELNKLARVQVDIPSSLDEIWSLDVKKSTARIPDAMRDAIRIAVSDSMVRSKKTVRGRGEAEASIENKVWDRIPERDGAISYRLNRQNPILQTLSENIGIQENKLLEYYLSQIETCFPTLRIQNDITVSARIVNTESEPDASDLKAQIVQCLSMTPAENRENLLSRLLSSQYYRPIAACRTELLRRLSDE